MLEQFLASALKVKAKFWKQGIVFDVMSSKYQWDYFYKFSFKYFNYLSVTLQAGTQNVKTNISWLDMKDT